MSAPPLRPGEVLPVVIVHWNRPERCLATVATFLAQPVPVRPVVVDNGSDPAALRRVRAGLPEGVEVVVTGANLGFGPGANAGFRHVLASDPTCDWVGLAPHDAQPHRDCLTRMLQAANSRPRSGLVSADFGDGATPVVHPFLGGILEPARVSEGWEPARHPHGTLMLARRALLEQVGLFDERYFVYCEEADLALRAARFGWETGLVRRDRWSTPTWAPRSPRSTTSSCAARDRIPSSHHQAESNTIGPIGSLRRQALRRKSRW